MLDYSYEALPRSRSVMERIRMQHEPKDDFDHPKLPVGHPLRRHVLYRAKRTSKYIFLPYDKKFAVLFSNEKARIAQDIPQALEIEHVGSTAVPGLGGKGIIDIAILVEQSDAETVSAALQKLGYEFLSLFSTEERLYFVACLAAQKYHVHLISKGSPIWQEFVGFRDYLIAHPAARDEYAAIKEKAVTQGLESKAYRNAKEPFMRKIWEKL